MKFIGNKSRYSKKDINLKEITINCSVKELDKIIEFLKFCKKNHGGVDDEFNVCHTHLQDWDKSWKIGMTDIVIYSIFDNKNNEPPMPTHLAPP